ncbi:LysR family transcriptional regulator [Acidaminobacter sp. JC074]|uniref:LysR family transcriptional regulator n=1 Tax=Acidaminobacter sp. JC074 TaxID=2530199 RepID=UPI001F105C82|nr:LysR family transcriptional regulator [Acidaminobacter sp. JC074]MCH4888436.1 LysR family transcriptional regulator [Acidaminobacter sp. JC074]
MNIGTLKYFKEIVEAQSISKVAQNSHISQSALSQIIQKLESELGYKLLNRSNKGVYPTDMGKIVYKYSGTMLRIYEKMEDELLMRMHKLDSVRINGYPSFINYSLPCILYKIKKKFPNYKFEVHSKSSEESFNDLNNELTDIAFVSEEPNDDRLNYSYIGKEKIVLAACSKNNIPDKISIKELMKYEFITLDDSYPINKFLRKKMKDIDLSFDDLNVMFEVDSIGAAKSSLSNNLGLSFLPYMSIKKEVYENEFKLVELTDFSLDYDMYLSSKKDAAHAESLQPIIEYFVKSGTSEFC